MQAEFSKIVDHPIVKAVYAVLLMVIVLCILYHTFKWHKKAEHLDQLDQIYTAGATMRFAQEPTATDQQPYTTGYNFEKMLVLDTGVKKN